MIAVDTNVLVRLLVRDDEAQYRSAHALLRHQHIFVPDSVLLETEWVLRFAYDFQPQAVCAALRGILGLKNVSVEDALKTARVLDWHESGLDFADALHLAKSEHLPALKTFDEAFIKGSKTLSGCKVSGL